MFFATGLVPRGTIGLMKKIDCTFFFCYMVRYQKRVPLSPESFDAERPKPLRDRKRHCPKSPGGGTENHIREVVPGCRPKRPAIANRRPAAVSWHRGEALQSPGDEAHSTSFQPCAVRCLSAFRVFPTFATVEGRIAAPKLTSPCSRSRHSGQQATCFSARRTSTSEGSSGDPALSQMFGPRMALSARSQLQHILGLQ